MSCLKLLKTKKDPKELIFWVFVKAGMTRLELAASAVTGQRSNQLSYTPNIMRLRNALLHF